MQYQLRRNKRCLRQQHLVLIRKQYEFYRDMQFSGISMAFYQLLSIDMRTTVQRTILDYKQNRGRGTAAHR